jgi:hypothetical protein
MIQARTTELPLYRLYVLRVLYALIGLVQGSQTWAAILHHTKPWTMWHGVSIALLGAFTALCLLGIRYPVKMLPLMIFELLWKLLWVLAAWLPLYLAHSVDADTADQFFPIALGVVLVPLVLPWGYIWKTYATAPGDRWR